MVHFVARYRFTHNSIICSTFFCIDLSMVLSTSAHFRFTCCAPSSTGLSTLHLISFLLITSEASHWSESSKNHSIPYCPLASLSTKPIICEPTVFSG